MNLITKIDSNTIECDSLLNKLKNECYHIPVTIYKEKYLGIWKQYQKPRRLQNLITCDLDYGSQGIIID